jgi:hypothetical protein
MTWAATRDASDAGVGYIDSEDGWLDISEFLDTAYGFVPIVSPITEPAVGYGATAAVVFVDRDENAAGRPGVRPNLAAVGGLATENGTRGLFAAHLGNWMDGRLRTEAMVAGADMNLEFFGLGGDRPNSDGLGYSIDATFGRIGVSYRLGESPFWAGLRYTRASTTIGLDRAAGRPPLIPDGDLGLELGSLSPSLQFDTRDNFFTPTSGVYVDASIQLYREDLGSDRDFEMASLTGTYHVPLVDDLYLGARASYKTSSDDTPFFLRPFVGLRGVQALRYQGEQAADIEAELRWQLHPRFSLVSFVGAGVADGGGLVSGERREVQAGGAGFRYLLARKQGLHMGLDVAVGPDDPIFYVVFGNAWLRP